MCLKIASNKVSCFIYYVNTDIQLTTYYIRMFQSHVIEVKNVSFLFHMLFYDRLLERDRFNTILQTTRIPDRVLLNFGHLYISKSGQISNCIFWLKKVQLHFMNFSISPSITPSRMFPLCRWHLSDSYN